MKKNRLFCLTTAIFCHPSKYAPKDHPFCSRDVTSGVTGSPLFVKDGVFDRYANKLFSERLTDINSAKYEKVAPRDVAGNRVLICSLGNG